MKLLIWTTRKNGQVRILVSSCFKPSHLQRIILGLRETLVKKYTVESTNEAEIRPEEQSEKSDSCGKNLWNEIQLKGP